MVEDNLQNFFGSSVNPGQSTCWGFAESIAICIVETDAAAVLLNQSLEVAKPLYEVGVVLIDQ